MVEDIIKQVVESTPMVAIALAWIISLRKSKQDAIEYYRKELKDCQVAAQKRTKTVIAHPPTPPS